MLTLQATTLLLLCLIVILLGCHYTSWLTKARYLRMKQHRCYCAEIATAPFGQSLELIHWGGNIHSELTGEFVSTPLSSWPERESINLWPVLSIVPEIQIWFNGVENSSWAGLADAYQPSDRFWKLSIDFKTTLSLTAKTMSGEYVSLVQIQTASSFDVLLRSDRWSATW